MYIRNLCAKLSRSQVLLPLNGPKAILNHLQQYMYNMNYMYMYMDCHYLPTLVRNVGATNFKCAQVLCVHTWIYVHVHDIVPERLALSSPQTV